MKKLLLILVLFITQYAFAIENAFERPNVESEFVKLDKIEKEVSKTGADFETLSKLKSEVLKDVELNTVSSISAVRGGDLPLGVPAIVWGFCCCIFGVALVYFQTDNDKEQVKKAAIGCAIGAVVGIGFSLLTGGFSSGGYYW
jgi:hypothetical protein